MKCWEFKRCGREAGGSKVAEFGVCPAYPNDGDHCANVSGTLCSGKPDNFAMKLVGCMKCDFYNSDHYDKGYSSLASLILACFPERAT